MTHIDKHKFLKHFARTELGTKKKVLLKNGTSITIKYKSEFKYLVKYLPGNYTDYYAPNFIFKTEKNLKIIPIPNFRAFLFFPIALAYLSFYEKIKIEDVWNLTIIIILFVILLQTILLYPSIRNIRKKVNERE